MESSRKLLILMIAGVIVAFTALALRSRVAEPPQAATVAPSERVIVAKRDIAPGTLIQTGNDLDWGHAPDTANKEELLHEGSVTFESYGGAVARRGLKAGEAITTSSLMKSGEGGFMSAVLGSGMRAVSIAVTATSGNAGFISPSDRVDLIVTHRIKMATGSGEAANSHETVVSETFVRDVRVLAVDQMLDNPENKAILAKTVTVEVTDRQAEQVAVANEMGKISMALRSLNNPEQVQAAAKHDGVTTIVADAPASVVDLYGNAPVKESGNFTRDSDVSQLLGGSLAPKVRVIRGDQIENMEFSK